MPNRLASETSPYLLQHAEQPRGLVAVGRRGVRRARASEDKPVLVSIGYAACHWCHVMEHESFEDAAVAGADERALRLHQGRPRGAPGRRRDLHGRRAGDDRPGRLAAERVPDAGAACRSTPAPTSRRSRATGCRAGASCWRRSPRPGRTQREEIAEASRADPAAAAGRRAARGAGRRARPARARRRGDGAAARLSTRSTAAGAARRSSRRARRSSSCWRRGEREMALHTLRRMAAGGMYDQVGGGFARYSVDAALGGPALREDALRQRAARPRVPARVPGHRRAAVPARVRGDAGLGAARAAPGRGRVRLLAGRRLRGRGGQASTSGRRPRSARRSATSWHDLAIAHFGVTEAGNFEGAQHPRARDAGSGRDRRDQGRACWRRARSGCGRGSTTSA